MAVVAADPAAADGARALLARLDMAAAVLPALDATDLDAFDVLWCHGAVPLSGDRAVLAWLQDGGRLVATGRAALLPYDLGLEPVAPRGVGDRRASAVVAFGPHPLFDGLPFGMATVGTLGAGVPCHDGDWPARADVVAVASRGTALLPAQAVVWELAVGTGGVLCLGLDVVHAGQAPPAALALMRNALGGGAVPHRARGGMIVTWPRPGTPPPPVELPAMTLAPFEPCGLERTPVGIEGTSESRPWTHAGRRAAIGGTERDGLVSAWTWPFRLMHHCRAPGAAAVRVEPTGVELMLEAGGRIRCWTALELPLVVWEYDGPAPCVLEWSMDLHRAWPFPADAAGACGHAVSPAGQQLQLRVAGAPWRALVVAEQAALAATDAHGGLACRATFAGPGRLIAVGAADAAEETRVLDTLARRGVAGLQVQRAQHAAQLLRYGTEVETPLPVLDRAFDWARLRAEASVVELPGTGRALLAGHAPDTEPAGGGPPCAHVAVPDACAAALGLLAAGWREAARALLGTLASVADATGAVPGRFGLSGVASCAVPAGTPAMMALAAAYARWVGDDVMRRELGAARARAALTADGVGPGTGIEPAANLTLEQVLAVARTMDEGARGAFALPAGANGGACPDQVRAAALVLNGTLACLWGVEPDAPARRVRLRPRLPAGWPRMALRRLRIGGAVLDLDLRRRPGTVVLRVGVRAEVPLTVDVALDGLTVESLAVDDAELPATRAVFEARERHEIVFRLSGAPLH